MSNSWIKSGALALVGIGCLQSQAFAREESCGFATTRGEDQAMRDAIDADWFQAHLDTLDQTHFFVEEKGWEGAGGLESDDPVTPFNQYALAVVLARSIQGHGPVVSGLAGEVDYTPGAIFPANNHNAPWEYTFLTESTGYTWACNDVNPDTGEMFCDPDTPEPERNGYGPAETLWLVKDFEDSNAAAIWGPTSHTIRYSCAAFDSIYGAARTASLMVHENFHGVNDGDASHGPCHLGATSCAEEWNFETPVVPLRYNLLAELGHVDAYQIENRYLCDLTEQPSDWIPDIARVSINQRTNARHASARFKNIDNLAEPEKDAGPAPLQCGLPDTILDLVPGEVCPGTGGALRCDVDLDCGDAASCQDRCCVEDPTCSIGSCETSADCGSSGNACLDGCCQVIH